MTFAPPVPAQSSLTLHSRRPRELVPALLVACAAGGFIAFFSVAVAFGFAGTAITLDRLLA